MFRIALHHTQIVLPGELIVQGKNMTSFSEDIFFKAFSRIYTNRLSKSCLKIMKDGRALPLWLPILSTNRQTIQSQRIAPLVALCLSQPVQPHWPSMAFYGSPPSLRKHIITMDTRGRTKEWRSSFFKILHPTSQYCPIQSMKFYFICIKNIKRRFLWLVSIRVTLFVLHGTRYGTCESFQRHRGTFCRLYCAAFWPGLLSTPSSDSTNIKFPSLFISLNTPFVLHPTKYHLLLLVFLSRWSR